MRNLEDKNANRNVCIEVISFLILFVVISVYCLEGIGYV